MSIEACVHLLDQIATHPDTTPAQRAQLDELRQKILQLNTVDAMSQKRTERRNVFIQNAGREITEEEKDRSWPGRL